MTMSDGAALARETALFTGKGGMTSRRARRAGGPIWW